MAKGLVFGGLNGGGGASVKSIQSGEAVFSSGTSKDITITSVDVNKCLVFIETAYSNINTAPDYHYIKAKLTSATNLNLSKVTAGGTVNIRWHVVEYENVKSLQTGEYSSSNTTEASITITSVDPTKCIAISNFSTTRTSTEATHNAVWVHDATTLKLRGGGYQRYVYWQVLEFK